MDKSTPRAKSKVFITGFQNFDLVYVPGEKEVVSRFQGLKHFPWNTSKKTKKKAR